jgi:hypothetical protein
MADSRERPAPFQEMTMNYNKQCLEMMIHLGQNFSGERMAELVQSAAMMIAQTVPLIGSEANMNKALDDLFAAIREDAQEIHRQIQEVRSHPPTKLPDNLEVMTTEDFLRHVFKPESLNG